MRYIQALKENNYDFSNLPKDIQKAIKLVLKSKNYNSKIEALDLITFNSIRISQPVDQRIEDLYKLSKDDNPVEENNGFNTPSSIEEEEEEFGLGGSVPSHYSIREDLYENNLQEKLAIQASNHFSKKVTADYWHFSTQYFNGREITYEVYSEKGGFWVNFQLKNNKLLLSSMKLEPIEKFASGGHIAEKTDNNKVRNTKVRFHLGRGENYLKWKVENSKTKKVDFYKPDYVQLVMYNCKLTNSPKTAMKIFTGEQDKAPIAWVVCEKVDVNGVIEPVDPKERLNYNPRTAPNWLDTDGKIVDNYVFEKLITFGRGVYYEAPDGELFELGGISDDTNIEEMAKGAKIDENLPKVKLATINKIKKLSDRIVEIDRLNLGDLDDYTTYNGNISWRERSKLVQEQTKLEAELNEICDSLSQSQCMSIDSISFQGLNAGGDYGYEEEEFKTGNLISSSRWKPEHIKQLKPINLDTNDVHYKNGGDIPKRSNTYAFVTSTSTTGKRLFKVFDHIPTNKEVYDYYQQVNKKIGTPIEIVDSSISIEVLHGFDRENFLKLLNEVALIQFSSKIKDIKDLMFSFDYKTFNVYEFEAELNYGRIVKVKMVDGVIFLEDKYEKGGELLKRKDGSYSERGLWDNIRANIGSGKEPTPEMLKQEDLIKQKYHLGGDVKELSTKSKQEIILNQNKFWADGLPTYKLSSDGNWVMKLDSRTNKYKTYQRFDLFHDKILEQERLMYAKENANKVFEYLDSNGAELLNKSIYGSRYYIYKNNYIRVSNHHNQSQQTNKETGLNKYKPNEHNFYSYEKDGWKQIISEIESLNNPDIRFDEGGKIREIDVDAISVSDEIGYFDDFVFNELEEDEILEGFVIKYYHWKEIGLVNVQDDKFELGVGYIWGLQVFEEYKGKGFGKKIMEKIFILHPTQYAFRGTTSKKSKGFWLNLGAEFDEYDEYSFILSKDKLNYSDGGSVQKSSPDTYENKLLQIRVIGGENSYYKRINQEWKFLSSKELELLKEGTKHELEHIETIEAFKRKDIPSNIVASFIAFDHINETPDYYSKLEQAIPEKMEQGKKIETKEKMEQEPEPANPTGLVTNNWNEVPVRWKNVKAVRPVTFSINPYDKGLQSIVKVFTGDDQLRPIMSAIHFEEKGLVCTDAHKLLHIAYNHSDFIGNYQSLDSKKAYRSYSEEEIQAQLKEKKFPNWEAVIPKDSEYVYEIDTLKLYQYCKVAVNYANKTTNQVAFKYDNKSIGFNVKFLIDSLEAMMKIQKAPKLYIHLTEPYKAAILSFDKSFSVISSTFTLLMPVMLWKATSPKYDAISQIYGASDIDLNKSIGCYFDFTDNNIHNANGTIADYKESYGDSGGLPLDIITMMDRFIKIGKTRIPILENVLVDGNGIRVDSLDSRIEIANDWDIPKGIYSISNNALVKSGMNADIEDFPKLEDRVSLNAPVFTMDSDVFKFYIEKAFLHIGNDDLRPTMFGFKLQFSDMQDLSLVSTDGHTLFHANLTKYAKDFRYFEIIAGEVKQLMNFAKNIDSKEISFFVDQKDNKKYRISAGRLHFEAIQIDGKYPNWRAIVPQTFSNELIFDLKDMYNCLNNELAKSFLKDVEEPAKKLTIFNQSNKIFISETQDYEKPDEAKTKEICEVKITKKELTNPSEFNINSNFVLVMPVMNTNGTYFNFNVDKLSRAISTIGKEKVVIDYNTLSSVYIFTSDNLDYKTSDAYKPTKVDKPKIDKPIKNIISKEPKTYPAAIKTMDKPIAKFTPEAVTLIPKHQLKVVKNVGNKEFEQTIIDINNIVARIPKLYGQDGIKDKMVYLHYFYGDQDWFVTELDKSTGECFGYADLGYGAELGYMSIPEFVSNGKVELDFYFEPKKWSAIAKPNDSAFEKQNKAVKPLAEKPKSIPAKADNAELKDAVRGLEAFMKTTSDATEKAQLKQAINGLKALLK